MLLDPQCEEVLRRVESWGSIVDATIDEARALEARRAAELGGTGPPMAEKWERSVGGEDRPVRARVYRPTPKPAPGLLVWLHGGGWVVGSPEHCDTQARALAASSGCVVVSVDYRLAPEHRFPVGLEDCYAGVAWAAEHAAVLGATPGRLAVGGDSAGGNLTAAITLLARDRGGPRIDLQLLVYPVLTRAADSPSYEAFADGYWLTADAMTWFWDHYLPPGDRGDNPLASPLLAESLVDLPPAIVATAEYDPLRDEGEQYVERLRAAGVPVQPRRYDGMLHGFLACAGIVDEAWVAFDELGHAVRDGLARPRPSRAVSV
jgi:acetyl esterase